MRADRILGILLALDRKKKVTALELANQFEVSIRTIYRDIDVLSIDFPIVSVSGSDGGYSFREGYKLPPLPFSRKDVLALHLLGSVAGQKLGLIEGTAFKNAFLKVLSSLSRMYGKDSVKPTEQILIDVEPWKTPPKVPRVVEAIMRAVKELLSVTFNYEKKSGKTEKQLVNPYGLCFRSGFWYLVGFSSKRKDYRLFRTDRISNLQVTTEKFQRDPKFNLEQFWNEELPRQYLEKGSPVKILFDKSVANDVKSKKWGAGEVRTLPDGHLELSFKTFDLRGLTSFVLSFGPKAELIEPPSLREQIKKGLQETIGRYK